MSYTDELPFDCYDDLDSACITDDLYEMEVCTKYLLKKLKKLKPYVYHISRHGSIYIKFKVEGYCSIRVADHPGRVKYKYKWNLYTTGYLRDKDKIQNDRGVMRYFYMKTQIHKLVQDILQYKSDPLDMKI